MPRSHDSLDLPGTPPPEVLDEVAQAWERAVGFAADGLEIHLGVGRFGGGVRAQLRLEDEILMRLSPSQFLALACGDPVPLPRGA
jgi:hypothetical protein